MNSAAATVSHSVEQKAQWSVERWVCLRAVYSVQRMVEMWVGSWASRWVESLAEPRADSWAATKDWHWADQTVSCLAARKADRLVGWWVQRSAG